MAEAPRLFLITPPIVDATAFAPLVETAITMADVACLLVRAPRRDEHALKAAVRALAPTAQRRGVAVLIEAQGRLATRLDVDGVHVEGGGEALAEALAALKPNRIVGVGGLASRDDAMTAGEAGVDYLMFGSPDGGDGHEAICERVAWWAEIFNVPCVGYARRPDLAEEVARAGADFVSLCEGLWDRPGEVAATLASVSRALAALPEGVP